MPHDDEPEEINARLTLALARLERRLTEQEIELVRVRIARQITNLRLLRTVALDNGDEPAPGFDPSPRPVENRGRRA